MSRIKFFLLLLLFAASQAQSQITIYGWVKNVKKEPVPGASISLVNSYSGTTSAADGSFTFNTANTGKSQLIISIVGYQTIEQDLLLADSSLQFHFILREAITELKAVIINAGSFEASDKKRTTVLKSIDIVTTAGQQADIVAALKTLPGAQQVGETEGLFVRGGTGAETKVFIDGLMVNNPFYSNVPDIAQRGRFSPLLFKGTNFSSGGYSAQFGQTLSSALVLESLDLPVRSESNWVLSNVHWSVTGQRLNRSKKGSIGGGLTYSNLAPYFGVVRQRIHYTKAPELANAEMHGRWKTNRGMFKFYSYAGLNRVGFDRPALLDEEGLDKFYLKGLNAYANTTYQGDLANNWKLYAGFSLGFNKDRIEQLIQGKDSILNSFLPQLDNCTAQARVMFTKRIAGLSKWSSGADWQKAKDQVEARDSIPILRLKENYLSFFSELDFYITSKFAIRAGLRFEQSGLLDQSKVSPRVSLAYKLSDKSQVSAAFGDFYQKPENPYLFRNTRLSFSKARHFILNYQYSKEGQILRFEFFHKKYSQLIQFPAQAPDLVDNAGSGYAKGVEFFWRDKTSFKGLDYWIAYSYLDTKRKFLDYPFAVQPGFAARHTANLVVKKFVSVLSTNFSMTYVYASGRSYYNPNRSLNEFMKDRTIDLHTMGFQFNYLTQIRKSYAVVIINMSNVIGNDQVYGYRFASTPDINGLFKSRAVMPTAKRFFFVGLYLSIGTDRRNSVLD